MPDFRPVAFILGQLVFALGLLMAAPLLADLLSRPHEAGVFAFSAGISLFVGGGVMLATRNARVRLLGHKQTFLLTVLIWIVLPFFAALPFVMGATEAPLWDAYFEATSALTTTGASVFSQLELLPRGLLLWRGMLQWVGGIGVIVMAMIFMPVLRLGGAQVFRPETGDTASTLVPRAIEVSRGIAVVYAALSLACALGYVATGMGGFDAAVHAMTTVSTGGMANYDSSFAGMPPLSQYVAIVFMILGTLPFYRFVQLSQGNRRAVARDSQIRSYLGYLLATIAVVLVWLASQEGGMDERLFRSAVFTVVAIASGTGLASTDYSLWGPFVLALLFCIGLVGGCAGSTSCAIKIYRIQIAFAAIRSEIRRLRFPSGVFPIVYEGRPVTPAVLNAIVIFVAMFMLTLAVSSVALSLCGLDFLTSVSAAAAMLANLGPGLTPEIGPVGNYAGLSTVAKLVLTATMVLGRLEILAVLVVLSAGFWRR